ncbi:hypothetical protein B0H34DRAFT_731983 [Crassisporium funariophilum]|nr:hypothetical protein B0H34DRAFT_731983 [Crassisporium funariophilum]
MLRRTQRLKPPLVHQKRGLSTPVPPYNFKKLRAFPFRLSPEEAQAQLAPWASITCDYRPSVVFSSCVNRILPALGLNILRPIKFAPVYFPAWIINAEVEASATYKESQQNVTIQFENTYIPGSHIASLSVASLWQGAMEDIQTVPFTDSLLTQYGEEVQCIPFTTSPLALDAVAASSSYRAATVNQELKFSPGSVKATMFSAYPLLIPLYLAQYEIRSMEGPAKTMTFFVEAHKETGLIMSNSFRHLPEANRQGFEAVFRFMGRDIDWQEMQHYFPIESRVTVSGISLSPVKDTGKAVQTWLDGALSSQDNIEKLASLSTIDSDDDSRIREMNAEEKNAIDAYAELTSEIMMVKRIIEAMSTAETAANVIVIGAGNIPKFEAAGHALETLKEKLQELEAKRIELKPSWWLEWELSSSHPKDSKAT